MRLAPLLTSQHAAWSALIAKNMEMLTASGFVIQHRLWRMAMAGPSPNARDRTEFQRMMKEKVDASLEATTAVSQLAWRIAPEAFILANQLWTKSLTQGPMLFPASPKAYFLVQQGLLQSFSGAMRSFANHNFTTAQRIGTQSMLPAHRRATANARRLAKVRSSKK